MSGFLNDKYRLALGIVLIFGALITFIYGWIERSNGGDFNQIWMLAVVMLFGASIHLQKIGSQNQSKGKNKF